MLKIETPIARTIALSLREQKSSGGIISEVPPSTELINIAGFVGQICPNRKIVHLGRTQMMKLHKWMDVPPPSSLFFQAVHCAYAGHHALGLRPEVLMYLINAVVAETVRRNPEEYRSLFTASNVKIDIDVRHDGLEEDNPNSPWEEVMPLFDESLRQLVPSQIMDDMLPGFSTADAESNAASLVAFMDAASPYYDYRIHTLCGIPRIVLFGEPADYQKLVSAATGLAEIFSKHLGDYFFSLLPVLKEIAEAAETGEIYPGFWGKAYKQFHMSGTDSYSGWLSAFLWYVNDVKYGDKQADLVVKDKGAWNWQTPKNDFRTSGINSGSEPSHVSSVPFTWHYLGEKLKMSFVGGIIGVDVAEGAITPSLSYGVVEG